MNILRNNIYDYLTSHGRPITSKEVYEAMRDKYYMNVTRENCEYNLKKLHIAGKIIKINNKPFKWQAEYLGININE